MKKLIISDKATHVTTLGPGKRFVVWVQGCRKKCKGCTSPELQSFDGGTEISPGALAVIAAYSGNDGITLSGGEPFEQAGALAELLSELKKLNPSMDVIVYTGYKYEDLLAENDADKNALISMTDLLIDGEYIQSLDDGLSLRGSSNQRVIPLTDRLKDKTDLYGKPGRKMQLFEISDYIKYAGIPDKRNNE